MSEFTTDPVGLPRCEYVIGSTILRLVDQIEIDPVGVALQSMPTEGTEFAVITDNMIERYCHARVSKALDALRQDVSALRSSESPWDQERVVAIKSSFANRSAFLPEPLKVENVGSDLLLWVERAPDNRLLEFIDWNEKDLRPKQYTMLERIKHAQAFVLDDTKQLVDSKFLPETAYAFMEKSIKATSAIHLADGYVTAIQAGAYAAAYYNQDKRRMAVRDSDAESYYFYEYIFHEYLHGAAAEGAADFQNLYGEAAEDRLTWFNEAVTQHITAAALYGDPEQTDPLSRRNQNGIYEQERNLLSLVLLAGNTRINIEDVVAAYFESSALSEQPLRTALREQLNASFKELFPELEAGLALAIARECNAAPSPKAYDETLKKWYNLICLRTGIAIDLTDEVPGEDLKVFIVNDLEPMPVSPEAAWFHQALPELPGDD